MLVRPGPTLLVDVLSEPQGSLNLVDDGDGGFIVRDRRGRSLRLRVMPHGGMEASRARWNGAMPHRRRSGPPPLAVVTEPRAMPEMPAAPPADYPFTDFWGRREPVLGFLRWN